MKGQLNTNMYYKKPAEEQQYQAYAPMSIY